MVHRLFHRRWKDARSETIWLTVYADLVTNLMLLFMVLFGLSLLGSDAFNRAVASMRPEPPAVKAEMTNFDAVAPALERELKDQGGVRVTEEFGAARLLLGDDLLFDSGRAQLKSAAVPVLREVAGKLAGMPFTIVVEGHTDDLPLRSTSPFRDNWSLSLARAMSVLGVLKESGIAPGRLAAAAYGAYHPRAGNDTVGGRRRNRRVEIALMRDFPTAGPPAQTGAGDRHGS